jgi:endonuclease/exonuclease/phosphatase family metal-dependent hydrolase
MIGVLIVTLLQIVTANIGGHRHLNDEPLNAAQIARDVRGILPIDPTLPTLIALQETTQVWRGEESFSDGQQLASQLGNPYRFMFAPEIDSTIHSHSAIWQRPMYRGYTRVKNGNGIVTNLPAASWTWSVPDEGYPGAGGAQAISTCISRAKLYSTGSRETQPRNLIVSCLQSPFGAVYFMTTHLSTLRGEDRHSPSASGSQQASAERSLECGQLLFLVAELRRAESEANIEPRPIILAADFNAQTESPEIKFLEQIFKLLKPPPSEDGTHLKHKIHIDHILISDPNHILPPVQKCFINTAPEVVNVTDHRPVIAILGNE